MILLEEESGPVYKENNAKKIQLGCTTEVFDGYFLDSFFRRIKSIKLYLHLCRYSWMKLWNWLSLMVSRMLLWVSLV